MFNEEAHFWLSGFDNKQKLDLERLNLQDRFIQHHCISKKSLLGLHFGPGEFFENTEGVAHSVNGDRYRAMMSNFFWATVDAMDLTNIWFQEDGAMSHTAHETLNLLHGKFEGFVI